MLQPYKTVKDIMDKPMGEGGRLIIISLLEDLGVLDEINKSLENPNQILIDYFAKRKSIPAEDRAHLTRWYRYAAGGSIYHAREVVDNIRMEAGCKVEKEEEEE